MVKNHGITNTFLVEWDRTEAQQVLNAEHRKAEREKKKEERERKRGREREKSPRRRNEEDSRSRTPKKRKSRKSESDSDSNTPKDSAKFAKDCMRVVKKYANVKGK